MSTTRMAGCRLIGGATGSGKGSVLWSRRSAEVDAGERFAVMVDGSVLCVDCVHEAARTSAPPSAATMVHAWIEAGPGVCCCWCGEAGQLDDVVIRRIGRGRWSS